MFPFRLQVRFTLGAGLLLLLTTVFGWTQGTMLDNPRGGLTPNRPSMLPNRKPAAATPAGPATTTGAPNAQRGLILAAGWNTQMQGGTETLHDLEKLMKPFGHPAVDLERHDNFLLLQQPAVHYLAPRREVVGQLPITSTMATSATVATPGFPKGSLSFYVYDARGLGQYNRISLVVDSADQVVAIQTLAETPQKYPKDWVGGFSCYNFVQHRVRSSGAADISHVMERAGQGVYSIDSGLRIGGSLKEVSRTYVPQPLVDLILHCVTLNESGVR